MLKWLWATDNELYQGPAPVQVRQKVEEEVPLPIIDQEEMYGELPLTRFSFVIADFEELKKELIAEVLKMAIREYPNTPIHNPRLGVERYTNLYAWLVLYGTIYKKADQPNE